MNLEKLKKACDHALGIESEIVERLEDEYDETSDVRKAFLYKTPTGVNLFEIPVDEHKSVGWHLEGKLNFFEDRMLNSLALAYRSERTKETLDIQKKRGLLQTDAIRMEMQNHINNLEEALYVAKTWMGRTLEEKNHGDFTRDSMFVGRVLNDSKHQGYQKEN